MKDRFRSALLGTALGDAWGYPYQNEPQPDRTPLPDSLVISDATQMTLALCAAMAEIDDGDLDREEGMQAIGQHFINYHGDRDYDRHPGASNTESLDRLSLLGAEHWDDVATHSGGSGAVMRVAASALLAPADEGVGWSVLQGILTHDSGVARAACAMVACMLAAKKGTRLLDVAEGLAGDENFDNDSLLTNEEKLDILTDLDEALITDLTGPDVPLSELISRVSAVHEHLTPFLQQGDFEELYRNSGKFVQILGRGWDAGSCAASALLLAQLYLDNQDQYAPHDFLHVAVNWPGNRNTRASLTGALIGSHLEGGVAAWEETREYDFESRYDDAVHCGVWKGFSAR